MKKVSSLLLLFFVLHSLLGQQPIEGTGATRYTVPDISGQIDYIVLNKDTTAKPVLLFLQGSLPVPLVIDFDGYQHLNLPFDYTKFSDEFHVVVISMPHTPVQVSHKRLNEQYCFITDSTNANSFSDDYLKNNVLSHYVHRAKSVMNDIQERAWADGHFHLVGHSQGAKVACVLASGDQRVSSVALLGFNAFGRYDELIRRERIALKSGAVTAETYRSNLDTLYAKWEDIKSDPDNFRKGYNSWNSFSIDYTPYLLEIDIPIFVGYGTEDVSAENCDLLPLKFTTAGKQNLTLKPYFGWDHNFFDVKNRGDGPNWNEVMTDVVKWMAESDVGSR